MEGGGRGACLAGEGHAARHEEATGSVLGGHHAELALLDEGDEVFDFFVEWSLVQVRSLVRVHGLRGLLSVGTHGRWYEITPVSVNSSI